MNAWALKDSGVIHQEFDGEAVVIDLASGSYFSLAGSGRDLWRQLAEGGATAEALAATLVAGHDVDAAQAAADTATFLADLAREGLIVPCQIAAVREARAAMPATRTAYVTPRVQAFHDLQDLFLLDPVHEVDPAAGWPMPAAPATPVAPAVSGLPSAIRRSAADVVSARAAGTAIVVNRDRGVYSRLEGAAADVWAALESGAARVSDESFVRPLLEGGFIEAAGEPADPVPTIAHAGPVVVETSLAEQIRAWGQRKRPVRARPTEASRGLCDRLDAWFERTAAASILHPRSVAGQRIDVDTPADGDCGQLAAALPAAHGGSATPPALVIRAWRGQASDAPPVLANLIESLCASWRTLCGPRGEVIDLHTDETSAIFDPGTRELSVIDRARGRAWAVKADAQPFRFWEIGSPFRFVLHDYFAHQGLQMVHGAAVGDARGAVLVVGMGGTGKSSTAMAAAAAGLRYLGDDYCLVDPRTRDVHCLYRTGKLVGPADLARLPAYRGQSINADSFERGGHGKGVYLVDAVMPDAVAATRPVRTILLPRIADAAGSRCVPGTVGEALEALVPSTVGQLPGADARDAERLASLVLTLPVMTLEAGREAAGVADAIRERLSA